MKKLFFIILFLIITAIPCQALTIDEAMAHVGKTCKIYYNSVGVAYGKILSLDIRDGICGCSDISEENLCIEIIVEEKNALNAYVYVHYLISTVDKLED